jgi:hypothetical protein
MRAVVTIENRCIESKPYSGRCVMNVTRAIGALLLTAGFLAAGLLIPAAIQAEVVPPDQMIGPQPEGTAPPSADAVIVIPNDEPAAKGFDQGFERPLKVPDRMADGDGDHVGLRTPDQFDAESIRESDERASTSF